MITICPNREKKTAAQDIKTTEEIVVKGEGICVPVEYYRYLECSAEFDDPKSKHDPLALAYKEYGRRHATGSVLRIRHFMEMKRMTLRGGNS